MKIYTVIVTYNAENWIEQCMQSLLQSSIQTEVVIVDNCSTDRTISLIYEKFGSAKLISSKENLGFGKANNIGIQHAIDYAADYIFLLNQDAFVMPQCIEQLVAVHKNYSEYGILSPMQYYTGKRLDFLFEEFCRRYTPEILSSESLETIYETSFINAAAWLLSVACVKKTGLFNPVFSHYGEDREYTSRVLYHGYKIGIVPEATAFHKRKQVSFLKNSPSFKTEVAKLYNIALAFASDVQHNFFRQLIVSELYILKNILRGLASFHFQSLAAGTLVSIKIVLNSFMIVRNRNNVKGEGCFLS